MIPFDIREKIEISVEMLQKLSEKSANLKRIMASHCQSGLNGFRKNWTLHPHCGLESYIKLSMVHMQRKLDRLPGNKLFG